MLILAIELLNFQTLEVKVGKENEPDFERMIQNIENLIKYAPYDNAE